MKGTLYSLHSQTSVTNMQCVQPVDSADSLFGPITTICCNGYIEKKIPWSAFTLTESDWKQVADVRDILECVRRIFEWEILPQVADFSGGEKSSACGRISHVFGVRSAHIFTIEIFS